MTTISDFLHALTLADIGKGFVVGAAVCVGWWLIIAGARDLFR